MDIQLLKEELVNISRRCYDKNLITATGGNISCRIPNSNQILIKASGSAFSDMTPSDVVLINLDGNIVAGSKQISKEWRFHAGIYKVRPDVNAVIHVHPPFATAIAANHDSLPMVTNHAKAYLKHVPTIGTAPSGSEELAYMVIEQFKDPQRVGILMKEHGIITVGKDFYQAFYLAEMLEDTAKIALFSKL
ncbi:class II aldolase/adducin family protein [Tepidimicrobium xylanilyticum]|uniref:L-fuculose-phosphate aldolase n=1 Tax=Tepidimicrobium xylanilyticum TaxID=1123352 RepID=A0A1H2QLJ5_9FIRM|nr:class II aldolase/adducin family protein [Tepidimicrobium xylanilyticum]GMG95630.1 fructose-bisphosphate aldolase [Tepidimicrobium xylanilyticum]SDW08011.1 L-fuculose-phosphate aldolase [Tepidimicrobium xylanilyticum]